MQISGDIQDSKHPVVAGYGEGTLIKLAVSGNTPAAKQVRNELEIREYLETQCSEARIRSYIPHVIQRGTDPEVSSRTAE